MRNKIIVITLVVFMCITIAYAANVKWTAKTELTAVADADILLIVDDPGGTPISKKITVLNLFDTIDTAAELDTIVADENVLVETEIDASSELLAIMDDETGTGLLCFATSPTFTTSILAASNADIGSTSAEFGDILIGDGKALKMGDDQDVTLTHVADTGFLLAGGTDEQLQIGDSGTYINQQTDGTLNMTADTIAEITAPNLRLEVDDAAYLNIATADGGITTISQVSDGTDEIKFGDGSDLVSVDSGNWDVSNAGVFSGLTGITSTGVMDFGGATSVEIPNAADPDVDAAGEISNDTDGANETGDVTVRAFDGTNQWPVGQKIVTLNFTLISPDTIDAADLIPVWHNTSGMTFTIVEWKAWSDDDDVSFEIEELTDQTDYTARTQVDACEIATDGTGVYYASDGTITHAAIEHDHSLAIDFDATDTPDYVQIAIKGWFNADVN